MVDLWGPGAFGAADAAATRPAYTPTDGALDPDTFYKDCSSPAEDDGTEWKSAALNMLLAQLRAVVRGGSVPATNLRDTLLLESILSGKASHAFATGTANAWTVTPSLAVPAYGAGRVLNMVAPATNTSTTVNVDVSTRGNRRIKKMDGSDPAIGDLVGGVAYPTFDDGASIRILMPLASDILNASARVGRMQVFTSSGTFVVPAGVTAVWVRVIGGGGAGGGAPATTGVSGAGGGAAGGYAEKWCAVTPGQSIAVTVGVGGTSAGAGFNGLAGGSSSFGAFCSASGGQGGAANGNTNQIGGVGTGGDLNLYGSGGQQGVMQSTSPVGAPGGGPPFGGGSTSNSYAQGYDAQGYGAGGGGAGGTTQRGGFGAPGLVTVQW